MSGPRIIFSSLLVSIHNIDFPASGCLHARKEFDFPLVMNQDNFQIGLIWDSSFI